MGVQKPGFLGKYCIPAFNLVKNPVSLVGVWRGGQKPGFYENTWLQHAKTAKNPVSAIEVRKSWINLATKSSNKFLLD